MKFHKAYKLRIYPTDEQKQYFEQNFGNARFIWNKMLSDRKEYYSKTGKSLYNAPAQYKKEFEFLKISDSLALSNVQMNLNKAYRDFFNKKSGFPKFKAKGKVPFSYTTNNQKGTIYIKDGMIKLPKIDFIKIVQDREFVKDSIIKSATVSRTKTYKYFVSVLVEYEKEVIPVEPKTYIGLDYSSPHMYVDSNGDVPGVPKPYRRYEEKLGKEQRKLSRMVHGSNNYKKQLIKINKIYEKIANIRKDFSHKISRKIANSYDVVCVEDLDLVDIAKKRKDKEGNSFSLGKTTYDNGWGMTRTMIEYKMKEMGKYYIKANKYFPSTKKCSSCGNLQEMSISERVYECECGLVLDRDLNAALNLKQYGIEQVARVSI